MFKNIGFTVKLKYTSGFILKDLSDITIILNIQKP